MDVMFKGPFYQHGSTLVAAWLSEYILYKVWDKINYPFLNINGTNVGIWEWISNFITQFAGLWLLIHAGI